MTFFFFFLFFFSEAVHTITAQFAANSLTMEESLVSKVIRIFGSEGENSITNQAFFGILDMFILDHVKVCVVWNRF
jgi:hypothetical protein